MQRWQTRAHTHTHISLNTHIYVCIPLSIGGGRVTDDSCVASCGGASFHHAGRNDVHQQPLHGKLFAQCKWRPSTTDTATSPTVTAPTGPTAGMSSRGAATAADAANDDAHDGCTHRRSEARVRGTLDAKEPKLWQRDAGNDSHSLLCSAHDRSTCHDTATALVGPRCNGLCDYYTAPRVFIIADTERTRPAGHCHRDASSMRVQRGGSVEAESYRLAPAGP